MGRKHIVAASLMLATLASVTASCGGGGGGGGSSGHTETTASSSSGGSASSSTSSSSSPQSFYTAQNTVTLASLSASELAPSIAAPVTLRDGTLIVPTVVKSANLWDMQVQAFTDLSIPVGNPVIVKTANTSGSYLSVRVLLPLSGGGLVVVQGANSSDYLVFQRIALGADTGGPEFRMPASGIFQRFIPLSNNNFAGIFSNGSTFNAAGKLTPYVQFYDAITGTGGAAFLIPATWPTSHYNASAAPLSKGGFVISWCDQCHSSPDKPPFTLYVQTYDEGGKALIEPVTVAVTSETNPIDNVRLFGLQNGGFGVIWNENTPANSANATPYAMTTKIRYRLYNADGTPTTNTLTLGSESETRQFQAVAVLSTGRIAVLWSTVPVSALGRETPNYWVDVLDTSGAQVGGSLAIAAPTDTSVSQGSLTARSNGGVAVLWQETYLGYCKPCRQQLRLVDPR